MDTETRVKAYDGTLRTIGRCEERLRCFAATTRFPVYAHRT